MFNIEVRRHTPDGKVRWNKVTDGRKALAFQEEQKAHNYARHLGKNAFLGDYRIVEAP